LPLKLSRQRCYHDAEIENQVRFRVYVLPSRRIQYVFGAEPIFPFRCHLWDGLAAFI
jgi:hypothetical protein